MAKEHVLVCEAMRAAVWGKPEPKNGYERAMPAKWDMAAGPGSANIPWMAYVAGRHYKRADSRMLEEYVALNKAKYQLSEPLSWIYSGWTVTAQREMRFLNEHPSAVW